MAYDQLRRFSLMGLLGLAQIVFLAATVALLGRGGTRSFVEFQAMLAAWPWMALCALGCEKLARTFGVVNSTSLAQRNLRGALSALLLVAPVLGIAAGALLAHVFSGGPEWPFLGLCASVWIVGIAGREALLGQGHPMGPAVGHSIALMASLLLMYVWTFTDRSSLVLLELCFTLPQLAYAWACWRAGGLRLSTPDWRALVVAVRQAWPFAAQTGAYLALACLDILVLRAAAPHEVLAYVLVTRPVAAALSVAVTVATLWTGEAARGGSGARRAYLKAGGLACAAGCAAALVTSFWGIWIYGLFAPGLADGLWGPGLAFALLAFAVGRALCEAGVIISGSLGTRGMAMAMGAAGAVGALAIASAGQRGWHAALWASAAAWMVAGLLGAAGLWRASFRAPGTDSSFAAPPT